MDVVARSLSPTGRVEAAQPRLAALLSQGMPLVLLGLTLTVFGGVLLGPRGQVVSAPDTDLASEFLPWRAFGAAEMLRGHLPLWNPAVFSGVPFLGGFQSALLYPPNWLYLVLPLDRAVNVEVALHVFLMGLFMSAWAARHGLHPLARLVSAVCAMFGSPFFLHVHAGHLATLDSMAWIPLILLCVDAMFGPRPLRWVLLGMLAVSMQILAGHPQTVFNTVVTVALYAGLRLIRAPARLKAAAAVIACFAGAAALTAAQLLTGAQEAAESTRAGAVSYAFASAFSFPPENFVTLLVPGFFGDIVHVPYWGRCYLWEMSLFMGVIGFALALYGAVAAGPPGRRRAVMMVLLLAWLALAAHTPLFRILYDHVPGFDKFRSHSKFIVPVGVFLSLLAGMGLETLLSGVRRRVPFAPMLLAGGLVAAGLGWWLREAGHATVYWDHARLWVAATGESYAGPSDTHAALVSRLFAADGCLRASALLLLCALLFGVAGRFQRAPQVLAALAVLEVVAAAAGEVPTFRMDQAVPTSTQAFLTAHPGDYRILQLAAAPESAAMIHAQDIWGYNPGVPARYAAFMAWTQGQPPAGADMYLSFHRLSPLYALLRLRYVFLPGPNRTIQVVTQKNPLPHLLLVSDWRRVGTLTQRLAALSQPTFDPRRTALLESEPHPAPVPGPPAGTVRLVSSDCDSLIIEADTPRPQILLVTDAYARGWWATPLWGSVQSHYDLLPADDILRAVPLAAGHHRLLLEYRPSAFVLGRLVSLVSLLIYLAVVLWTLLGENLIRGLRVRLSRRSVRSGPSVSA